MNKNQLKILIEEKYDSMIKATSVRGSLMPWEEGYCEALNEVYIDLDFGRLTGNNKFRRDLKDGE